MTIVKYIENRVRLRGVWNTSPVHRRLQARLIQQRALKLAWFEYVRVDAFTGLHAAAEGIQP